MTLDELELRVAAAFPEAAISFDREEGCLVVQFKLLLDLGAGCAPTDSFNVDVYSDGRIEVLTFAKGLSPFMSRWAAEREIERRILSVTAHQLIAARRRLAQEVPA